MIEHNIFIPNTSSQTIYTALLSSEEHSKIIGDKAEVSDKVGDGFSTFSGYASGKNVELVPYKKIAQSWRASNWPENHYSDIVFEFEDTNDGVKIHFVQTNLPDGAEDEFDDGWRDNYWGPLIDYFK